MRHKPSISQQDLIDAATAIVQAIEAEIDLDSDSLDLVIDTVAKTLTECIRQAGGEVRRH